MSIKYIEEFRDNDICRMLIGNIHKISSNGIRLMEVCGTHTMSIFKNGIRSVLPDNISLISGPGCPVCVTSQQEVDAFIQLCQQENAIVATFGDLLRVPGTYSSLQKERACGKDIRLISSTFDALEMAKNNPDHNVFLLGVGFEATAPTVAVSLKAAQDADIKNYFVYSAHKQLPPALYALMQMDGVKINGFLLPGHVSVIIGTASYESFYNEFRIPCIISGFEPVDILEAVYSLTEMIESKKPGLMNGYKRAVTFSGNEKARKIMNEIFEPSDADWRGLGTIAKSGLKIRDAYAAHDAEKQFDTKTMDAEEPKGCCCGQILTGKIIPPECSLFKTHCNPVNPIGPCMVSSEGTCAAYYKYHED